MRQYWLRILAIICITLVVCAGAGSFLHVRLDYCKQIISYEDGVAAIEESGLVTTIFHTDSFGKIQHVIKTLNTNFLTAKVRNYRILFEGENGELYVMSRVYSEKKQEIWEVCLCNWNLSILQKKYVLQVPEEYRFVTGSIPVVSDGKLYVQYQTNDYDTIVTMAHSQDGNREEVRRVPFASKLEIERCIHTEYGLVSVSSTEGVFLNDKCIYAVQEDENGMPEGLASDGKRISFIDIGRNKQVIYQLETGEFSYRDMTYNDFEHLQSTRLNMDGRFTACLEQNGDLVGCEWMRGKLNTYTDFQGSITPLLLLKVALVNIVLCVVLVGGWSLLCVRKLKNDKDMGVQFVGVATIMTILSLMITILAVPVVAKRVYGHLKEQNDYWLLSNSLSSAKYISSTIFFMIPVDVEDEGIPVIEQERYHVLEAVILDYQEKLRDAILQYDYCVMTLQNDEVYCIYSNEFSGTLQADYAVSLETKEQYRKSLLDGEYRNFEDKRSIGLLEYTLVTYVTRVRNGDGYMPVTVGVITDGYEQRLVYIRMLPEMIQLLGLLVIVLLVTVNLALRVVLLSVRRLGKALDLYVQTGDYGKFDFGDTTEIGKAAHALRAMAGGLEVHKRDISNSNLSYQRLISVGILKLLGKDSITQAVIGEGKETEVLGLKFLFDEQAEVTEQLGDVMRFVASYEGEVLDFNQEKLLATISPDLDVERIRESFETRMARFAGKYRIQLSMAEGTIEVGSVGMEDHAYLVAVGNLFDECR